MEKKPVLYRDKNEEEPTDLRFNHLTKNEGNAIAPASHFIFRNAFGTLPVRI